MKQRLISSIIILLTGILLVLDVILDKLGIEFKNTFGFNSSSNFVFYTSQWVAIILLIFASKLKPYNLSYISPVYSIAISGYWVFFLEDYSLKHFFEISVLIVSILVIVLFIMIWNFFKIDYVKEEIKNEKIDTLEKFLDLTILYKSKNIKNK